MEPPIFGKITPRFSWMKMNRKSGGVDSRQIFKEGDCAIGRQIGPIELQNIVRYAGASGDFNPIHFDQDFARSLGFPNVFVMGMLPGAILGEFARDWLSPLRINYIKFRFTDKIWPHELLILGGEVKKVESGSIPFVEAHLWMKAPDGSIKITANCTAIELTVNETNYPSDN
jgi:hypothetical protein